MHNINRITSAEVKSLSVQETPVYPTVAVRLAAANTPGGVLAWPNPEPWPILVKRVILSITAPSSAACTIEVGQAATAGTASGNLIPATSVATAEVIDNLTTAGSKPAVVVAQGGFLTASVASGTSAGLAGTAYIEYAKA